MKLVNANVDLMQNKQRWNKDKCRCECREELSDKERCDKGFIWNPSDCNCESDKSCDIIHRLLRLLRL